MRQRKEKVKIEDEDRISMLPDRVIHKILSFFEVGFAVRTSILSKRWKFIWTTLPFLNFEGYDYTITNDTRREEVYTESIQCLLSRRNHQSPVLKLNLYVPNSRVNNFTNDLIEYAISHNVVDLNVVLRITHHPYYDLLTFSSNSIEKLKLGVCLKQSDQLLESDCCDLPALTTLHLIYPNFAVNYKLSNAFFICLPALTTLCIDGEYEDLLDSSISFSLPALRTLHLARCNFPKRVWDLPALLSLELEDVEFPENISELFSALVGLQNLTFRVRAMKDLLISCPQLVNLKIRWDVISNTIFSGNIIVLTPKVCNFSSVGIFAISFGVSKLENVNISLQGWTDERWGDPNRYYQRLTSMFQGLGSAKILSLDVETIQALSAISDILTHYPSPFYNLKYVKLPLIYRESSISSSVRSYLLGGSPGAKIVTTLPQVHEEPLATSSKDLVDDSQDTHMVCVDTVKMGIQEDYVVGNSVVGASTAAGIYGQGESVVQGFSRLVPNAPVAGADNDQGSSFAGDSDFGLWQGHEVNQEFIRLLDLIMKNYPETFEHFTTKSKKFCTMKLNMLCTSVNDFTKTTMTEVSTEKITEYRALFAAVQKLGFNVNWLVSCLDYVEELRFSQPLLHELYAIDSGIQDLETIRAEKMAEIEKTFGNMGTKLVVGNIGDNIFSGP